MVRSRGLDHIPHVPQDKQADGVRLIRSSNKWEVVQQFPEDQRFCALDVTRDRTLRHDRNRQPRWRGVKSPSNHMIAQLGLQVTIRREDGNFGDAREWGERWFRPGQHIVDYPHGGEDDLKSRLFGYLPNGDSGQLVTQAFPGEIDGYECSIVIAFEAYQATPLHKQSGRVIGR